MKPKDTVTEELPAFTSNNPIEQLVGRCVSDTEYEYLEQLRDKAAVAVLLRCLENVSAFADTVHRLGKKTYTADEIRQQAAEDAYALADALLKVRG